MYKNINDLVDSRERVLFPIVAIASVIVLIASLVSMIAIPYIVFFIFLGYLLRGFFIGSLKQNAIKITDNQFGDIYKMVKDFSSQLKLETIPEIYIIQSGGALNAFVMRFLSRNFVVIYSDILCLAYEEGEEAVKFVIAHELAHIKRRHISKMFWTSMGHIIPFLGSAYSRACERTCDSIAAHLAPSNPAQGILVLLAGKKLHSKVNISELIKTANEEIGFWSGWAELISSHPTLSSRLKRMVDFKKAGQK